MKLLTALFFLGAGFASAFVPAPPATTRYAATSRLVNSNSAVKGPLLRMSSESGGGGNPFESLLGGLFQNQPAKAAPEKAPKIPDLVVTPAYSLAIGFAFYALFFVVALQASILGVILGGLNLLFASFLAVQAKRLRFVFDESAFELKNADATTTGENIVVGGSNRWTYDSFVNYDFLPSKEIPILVYFKENQTPSDKWSEGPGQFDERGGGQIHFFPAIGDCRELDEQFKIRGCAKVED